jgi:hypothetical protein
MPARNQERQRRNYQGFFSMRNSRIAAFLVSLTLVLVVGLARPVLSQVGHPAKGSWIGYWGPTEKDQRRLILNMEWENNQVVGVINPGPKAAKVKRTQIDYDTWTMIVEADMPDASGKPVAWVATGKLENLGSWNNRRYTGTYKHGGESGRFLVTLH